MSDAATATSVSAPADASLMLAVAQVVVGDAQCGACEKPAALYIATGADPAYEPLCFEHGRPFLASTLSIMDMIRGG